MKAFPTKRKFIVAIKFDVAIVENVRVMVVHKERLIVMPEHKLLANFYKEVINGF